MKLLIVIFLWFIVSIAYAQEFEGNEFFNALNNNPAKVEGASFRFNATIKRIEVIDTKSNERVAIVELATGKVVNFFCSMPVSEAAELDKHQKVDVKGMVLNTSSSQEYNEIVNRLIPVPTVVARCDITPPPMFSPHTE